MANTRSAEKRNRQAQKRRLRNVKVRTGVKGAVKKAREAISQGNLDAARLALHEAERAIDKASSKGVLHRRAASRRISRLAHALATVARTKAAPAKAAPAKA